MKILLIHTGGTIAMAAGPEGLSPRAGILEAGLAALGEGTGGGTGAGDVTIKRLEPLIDSAQIRFEDWNRMADAVVAAAQAGYYGGVIITHGTDTLAYSAAALSFALRGVNLPVILTGSMLPFGTEGSDAPRNLGDALAACTAAPAGVWVQFAGKRLHGARLRKTHSEAQDAFGATAAARPPHIAAPAPMALRYGLPQIGIITLAPGQSARAQAAFLAAVEGAVLRVFGAGTLPDAPELTAALVAAGAAGKPLIAVSQCDAGGVALGSYAAGAAMIAAGVTGGGTLTPEAAYAKLALALSLGAPEILGQDLCGEM